MRENKKKIEPYSVFFRDFYKGVVLPCNSGRDFKFRPRNLKGKAKIIQQITTNEEHSRVHL